MANPYNNNPVQPPYQTGYYGAPQPAPVPNDPPLSPWGYIGYQFLFGLPGIGFIICIIVAVTASNKNVKNFAIAQIILAVAIAVITIILTLIFGISLTTLVGSMNSGSSGSYY